MPKVPSLPAQAAKAATFKQAQAFTPAARTVPLPRQVGVRNRQPKTAGLNPAKMNSRGRKR